MIAHAGLYRENRPGQHARKARQHGAEGKDQHEKPANIHAKRGYHRCIGRPRAHQHAKARALHQKPKAKRGGDASAQNGDAIKRILQPWHQHHAAFKQRRHRHLQRRRTPNGFHCLIEKQDDAKRRQHLRQMITIIKVPEHQHFQQQPK